MKSIEQLTFCSGRTSKRTDTPSIVPFLICLLICSQDQINYLKYVFIDRSFQFTLNCCPGKFNYLELQNNMARYSFENGIGIDHYSAFKIYQTSSKPRTTYAAREIWQSSS